ncbi:MAG TPA: Asp-tRNA(Asn)/Glu-tRNA(Gln) amidotransferase subunit GatC [Candidatus Dormibacteraeota bacterium]|nr:Asp-tRNA(Asn)/Glu-tRNA(Gln) amidotransferase subunit GatC [Candidatus Dormibacteraeota bacterium]
MTLSRDQVRHVALLARLGLRDGEEDFYAEQLSRILDHIDRLAEVDTEAIPPTAQVVEVRNVMRADEPRPSLSQEQAIGNAPVAEGGFLVVRAIQEPDPG